MSWGIVQDAIRKFCNLLCQPMIVALALFTIQSLSHADVERVVDYEYDNAGNIVRIITREQIAPPAITLLTPNFINVGRTVFFTATGSNLLDVAVTTDVTGLSVSDVVSSADQVTFRLTASPTVLIGSAILRFATGLGETQEVISVAEEGPGLTTNPSPITIDLSGTPNSVQLTFSEPRPEIETYTLAIGNASIATIGSSSFTILVGETQATLSLTGVIEGATNLQITLPAKFYSYSFPVYASSSYEDLMNAFPDMQQRNLFANPVGVVIQPGNPYLPNTVTTDPVGVLVDSNAAFYSSVVGVYYGDGLAGQLLSKPVGVMVSSTTSFAYSSPVGTVYGPILDGSQPASAAVGTTVDFDITGFNLAEVQTATVTPGTDVTVGAISVNPAGTLLTVSITIDLIATPGHRELVLQDAVGPIISRSGLPLTFDIQ